MPGDAGIIERIRLGQVGLQRRIVGAPAKREFSQQQGVNTVGGDRAFGNGLRFDGRSRGLVSNGGSRGLHRALRARTGGQQRCAAQ